MSDLTLVLESARISSGRLDLTIVEHPRDPESATRPTWRASLTADDFAAQLVTAESPEEEERSLAEYFEWLYEDRLGWDGPRAWQSELGALRMVATHDQINVVKLDVTLRGGFHIAQWTAAVDLRMDPGRFHRLGLNANLYWDRFRGVAVEETY